MSVGRAMATGPRGGLRAGERVLRGWRWDGHGRLISRPVRCKRDEWYVARARPARGVEPGRAALLIVFSREQRPLGQCCLRLCGRAAAAGPRELLGWFQTPLEATHLQLCLPRASLAGQVAEIVLHNVSERDPKCHPLASVPRWDTYRPPFTIRRVVLPTALAGLTRPLDGMDVKLARQPRSVAELTRLARGAACVLDPGWIEGLKLSMADLERVASSSWLLVDLASMTRLLPSAGVRLVSHADEHAIMSARVEYADVPTRGLALQDVVPYTTIDEHGRFRAVAIKADRAWKRHADRVAFATLLSGETPWADKHGDVFSAMRAVGGGELIATDLPWLVAGRDGPLLTPRLAAHLLRMHLGLPIKEHVQYWNRWGAGNTIVRDIADLERRCVPLRAVRWARDSSSVARLGISLDALESGPARHLFIRTGRIDNIAVHDGLPPEPMMIFMKWLAREVRELTDWARQNLAHQAITWQFDTVDGLKYAANFDAAESLDGRDIESVRLRLGEPPAPGAGRDTRDPVYLPDEDGLHGDGSLILQDRLTRRLCRLIEENAGR